jgi:hypothetical protein
VIQLNSTRNIGAIIFALVVVAGADHAATYALTVSSQPVIIPISK